MSDKHHHYCFCLECTSKEAQSNAIAPSELPPAPGSAPALNNQRLTQAVSDFVYNVEHSNVAGWGDCSTDVRADASFKELKAALAEAQNTQAEGPNSGPGQPRKDN